MHFVQVLSLFSLASLTLSHGTGDVSHEIKERRDFLATQKRTSLSHCAAKLKARGVTKRNIERRVEATNMARRSGTNFYPFFTPDLTADGLVQCNAQSAMKPKFWPPITT